MFDIFKGHEPSYDHTYLALSLNFIMQKYHMHENYQNQSQVPFGKSKMDLFLNDIYMYLHHLTSKCSFKMLYNM